MYGAVVNRYWEKIDHFHVETQSDPDLTLLFFVLFCFDLVKKKKKTTARFKGNSEIIQGDFIWSLT